jgi:hypothetical protein
VYKKELLKKENYLIHFFKIYNYFFQINGKRKNNLDYNFLTNSAISIKFIEKDIFSFSLIDEQEKKNEKLICKFCFSILKKPINLSCGHYFCEDCFKFLKINQTIDFEPNNQIEKKIEKKNLNEEKIQEEKINFNCFICKNNNSLNFNEESNNFKKNEIENEIKNFFNEKKSFEKNCEYETEDGSL